VKILARSPTTVDVAGRSKRAFGIDVQERMDPAINSGDAVEMGLGGLDRADLLAVQAIREHGGAGAGDVGSHI
jgi:hypothetical protein